MIWPPSKAWSFKLRVSALAAGVASPTLSVGALAGDCAQSATRCRFGAGRGRAGGGGADNGGSGSASLAVVDEAVGVAHIPLLGAPKALARGRWRALQAARTSPNSDGRQQAIVIIVRAHLEGEEVQVAIQHRGIPRRWTALLQLGELLAGEQAPRCAGGLGGFGRQHPGHWR
eukprot:scaffold26300_cov130-Isochrysis_galbana.AAC.2